MNRASACVFQKAQLLCFFSSEQDPSREAEAQAGDTPGVRSCPGLSPWEAEGSPRWVRRSGIAAGLTPSVQRPHPAASPVAQASGPERSFGLTDPARGCGVGVSSGKEQEEVTTQCGWRTVGRGQGRIPLWDYKVNKMSFLKQGDWVTILLRIRLISITCLVIFPNFESLGGYLWSPQWCRGTKVLRRWRAWMLKTWNGQSSSAWRIFLRPQDLGLSRGNLFLIIWAQNLALC